MELIVMKKNEYLVFGIILIGCVGIAWGASGISKDYLSGGTTIPLQTPVPSSKGYHAYSQLDNGTTARVHSLDIITVRLPENPTTGYRWNITTGPGFVTIDDTYIYTEPSARLTGVGGVRFVTLEPKTSGTQQINAIYKRPWEEDSADHDLFSMTFVVD